MKFKKVRLKLIMVMFLALSVTAASNLYSQADVSKIVGSWEIELEAEGEYFYLSMIIEAKEGKLSGTISEASGFFVDVPLNEIVYDGTDFNFQFEAATPPDGMERLCKCEFTVSEDNLEGLTIVEDLGISAPSVATREKK